MERLREVGDFGYILRKSPGYDDAASTDSLSAFTYMNPNDRDLYGCADISTWTVLREPVTKYPR